MNNRLSAGHRWAWWLLLLPLPLLVLGCGGNEVGGVKHVITANDLASLVLTTEEASKALGFAVNELELRQADLGQEFEGIDLQKYGLIAGYVALYRSPGEARGAFYTASLFETTDGATGVLEELLVELAQERGEKFDAGRIGDEAQGLVFRASNDEPASAWVVLRADRVVASIVVLSPERNGLEAGARQLAKAVSDKIEAFLES